MRFDNVRLLVDDLPACFRFYRDVMGFDVWEGDDSQSMYAALGVPGGGYIGLYNSDAMAARVGVVGAPTGGRSRDQFAIVLMTDALDELIATLKARGAQFETDPVTEPWGGRTAHLRDPAGNLIELLQS